MLIKSFIGKYVVCLPLILETSATKCAIGEVSQHLFLTS